MENNKIILDTTNKSNSITLDSTRPDFVKPQPKQQPQSSDTSTQTIVPPNTNEQTALQQQDNYNINGEVVSNDEIVKSARLFTMLLNTNMKYLTNDDLQPGKMVFFKYDAKDKDVPYDKTPLIFILNRSNSYTLGLNFNWFPIPLRIVFIQFVLKANRDNIKNSRPIYISYQMIKPVLHRMGSLNAVIRLYINSRMSSRGLVIDDPSLWISAAKLKTNNISGGFSPEQLYSKAIDLYNTNRRKKIYRNKKLY
jgi:hypothetical protein